MANNIVLVQPSHPENKNVRYFGKEIPLNIAYLNACLEKKGFSTSIIDLQLHDNPVSFFKKELKRLNPEIVGFGAFTIDITNASLLARIVKEYNPGISTIIGGLHASALPVRTLEEFKFFDYLVYGESFVTITELAEAIKSLRKPQRTEDKLKRIDGIVYRSKKCIKKNRPRGLIGNLDSIPFPSREKLENEKYRPHTQKYKRLPSTGLISSIGCPFQCAYCSVNIVHHKVRFRSPENVLAEMELCIDKFGISDFRFFDDCMTLNHDHIVKLCRLIIQKKLDIFWNCQSRVDAVDFELLKLMKKARCHQITYGVETGSEKSLKVLNKGTTLQQAREAIKATKKAGLESGASFIIGVPGETIDDIKQTINFAKELSPDIATFYILKAYPGSELYSNALKANTLKKVKWNEYTLQNPSVLKESLDDKTLTVLLEEAYHSFYFRPAYATQRAKKFFKNPLKEPKEVLSGLKMLHSYFKK